jgi:hypothetical protein
LNGWFWVFTESFWSATCDWWGFLLRDDNARSWVTRNLSQSNTQIRRWLARESSKGGESSSFEQSRGWFSSIRKSSDSQIASKAEMFCMVLQVDNWVILLERTKNEIGAVVWREILIRC